MRNVAREGDRVAGSVSHHAGHTVGLDNEGNPIFCQGHVVSGFPHAGSHKLRVQGKAVLTDTDHGESSCPCDGGPVAMKQISHRLRIQGADAVLDGDAADFHGAGVGSIEATGSKLRVRE